MSTHNQHIVDSCRQRVVELDAGRLIRDKSGGCFADDTQLGTFEGHGGASSASHWALNYAA